LAASCPLILVTNDDGIRSPGLLAAVAALEELGELLIAAPVTQQTGMGRGAPPVIGGHVEEVVLQVRDHKVRAYAISGSPAQVVLYAVLVLAPRRPDLVVAGINYGENIGTTVTVSGTVGAALQAAELGIPGLAVSLETDKAYHYNHGEGLDWRAAAHMTRYFARAMLRRQLPFDVDVLKIDVPADATPETPWRVTRQSRQPYYEVFRVDEEQRPGEPVKLDYRTYANWKHEPPDTDLYALARERMIAVTPLSQDLTSRTDLRALEKLLRCAGEET
jgi:5'-nucleotidase